MGVVTLNTVWWAEGTSVINSQVAYTHLTIYSYSFFVVHKLEYGKQSCHYGDDDYDDDGYGYGGYNDDITGHHGYNDDDDRYSQGDTSSTDNEDDDDLTCVNKLTLW